MATRKQLSDPSRPVDPPKPKITLTLVVEYEEDQDMGDIVEAAKELIEKAREYGYPTSAKIIGMPPVLDLKP